jgi:eukaryotic-like serine/threonine-protein kinase
VPSFVRSAPTVGNGLVYFGSDAGVVYALDADTGALAWSTLTPGIGTTYARSSPALANGLLYMTIAEYFPLSNGYEYAFNALNGRIVWSATMIDYATSSPAVAGGVVYAASFDWRLYAFDASTGDVLWKYVNDRGMNSSPAIVNGYLYVADLDGNLLAFTLT